jgi:hypothetical protein
MITKRTVELTQEDIANGVRENCKRCPGALAIQRAFPELKYLSVRLDHIFYSTADKWPLRVCPPFPLRTFIRIYDSGGNAVPCSFELELDLS